MTQPDLFEGYPDGPGWKEADTSRAAAEAISSVAGRLRLLVYSYIKRHPLLTADEIADALDESRLTIRPRVSELRVRGFIVNDGRGRNASGKAAHRWRVAQ